MKKLDYPCPKCQLDMIFGEDDIRLIAIAQWSIDQCEHCKAELVFYINRNSFKFHIFPYSETLVEYLTIKCKQSVSSAYEVRG